jgi:hypothetical protein
MIVMYDFSGTHALCISVLYGHYSFELVIGHLQAAINGRTLFFLKIKYFVH